jgi:hypothetical protein
VSVEALTSHSERTFGLDLSKDQIEALHVMPWEKAMLRALHDYGGFIMDAGGDPQDHTGGVVSAELEDDAQFAAFGNNPTPMQRWAASIGWGAVPIRINPDGGWATATRYIATDHWKPVDWATHLHIVDPCYASEPRDC